MSFLSMKHGLLQQLINFLPYVGSLHCVACTDAGEVYTWGDNDEGQLGDGTTLAAQRPRLLIALQVF